MSELNVLNVVLILGDHSDLTLGVVTGTCDRVRDGDGLNERAVVGDGNLNVGACGKKSNVIGVCAEHSSDVSVENGKGKGIDAILTLGVLSILKKAVVEVDSDGACGRTEVKAVGVPRTAVGTTAVALKVLKRTGLGADGAYNNCVSALSNLADVILLIGLNGSKLAGDGTGYELVLAVKGLNCNAGVIDDALGGSGNYLGGKAVLIELSSLLCAGELFFLATSEHSE